MSNVECIRLNLEKYIGSKIRVTTKEGRKRVKVCKGVLESIYPHIFIVRYEGDGCLQIETTRESYSYVDVLTRNVEVALYRSAG